LNDWFARKVESQSIKRTTAVHYKSHIDKYLVPAIGHLRLADLRAHHIERMLRQIREGNLHSSRAVGATAQQRLIATLRSALRDGVRRGDVEQDPTAHVVLPRRRRNRQEPWDAQTFQRFLEATSEHPLVNLFLFAGLTGLRRGELCGLRWVDLDLDDGVLQVNQQIVLVAGRCEVSTPKSENSAGRSVYLDGSLLSTVNAIKSQQARARLAWGPSWVNSGLVFSKADGNGWNPDYVSKTFAALVAKTDVPKTRFHDLRHLSASLGAASGESLLQVSRRLGHSTIAITADTYSHVFEDQGRDAAEARAALLISGTTGRVHSKSI